MRQDPRCPFCDGKVSATAEWCMHCGREFDAPVDANGQPIDASGDPLDASREIERDGTGVLGSLRRSNRGTDQHTSGGTVQRERERSGRDTGRTEWGESGDAGTDSPAVPSGLGTGGPSYLPSGGLENGRTAARFLGGLGLVGAAGVAGLGLSLPTAGAAMAILAWLGSVGWLARTRSAFDAMRYGSYSVMILLIFVAFALAFAAEGATLGPFLLTLVPVAVATLLVAGVGDTIAETP